MSQASKPNTTSRRTLLTRAPAATAAALAAGTAINGLAMAAASSAGSDPIFAVLHRHREAWSAHQEEEKKFDVFRKKDRPLDTGIVVGEFPASDREGKVRMQPIIACHHGQIAANIPEGLSGTDAAAWMEEKKAELAQFRHEEIEALRSTPRDMAYAAWCETWGIVDRVTMQLLTTRPMTIAGIVALLEHWEKFTVEDQEMEEFVWGDRPSELVDNVVEALRAIG
jgi:hypothetical protein